MLQGMAMVIQMVGPASPLGQALAKAIGDIGKHIPPGSVSPQGTNDFVRQMAMRQRQMGSQQAALAAQGQHPQVPQGAQQPQPQQAA